jgi:hypothetical protein
MLKLNSYMSIQGIDGEEVSQSNQETERMPIRNSKPIKRKYVGGK